MQFNNDLNAAMPKVEQQCSVPDNGVWDFFILCFSHYCVPDALMKTDRISMTTEDASFVVINYRPVSLAMIIAKVLVSIIETLLPQHVKLYDAQFEFRPGLLPEAAILNLQHTVENTSVQVCF